MLSHGLDLFRYSLSIGSLFTSLALLFLLFGYDLGEVSRLLFLNTIAREDIAKDITEHLKSFNDNVNVFGV